MDDFIDIVPTDYKGYPGYMAAEGNESYTLSVHVPCGLVIASRETHLKTCPADQQ